MELQPKVISRELKDRASMRKKHIFHFSSIRASPLISKILKVYLIATESRVKIRMQNLVLRDH